MDSFALIIFGITSNLAQKYSIQALYDMEEKGLIPNDMVVIGTARRELTEEQFRQFIDDVLHQENRHHKHPIKNEVFSKLCQRFHYLNGELDDPGFYLKLKEYLEKLKGEGFKCDNRIYYLATYPELYHHIFENLKKVDLNKPDRGFVRLMIEKPIGHDLESAKELNKLLSGYFSEDQIYRIDHYLGKETLQNILTFRFGNSVFEPLIRSEYVDHIQIQGPENFGIGTRGGYYDSVGALRDVGQNHHLQMLAFATMDAPYAFNNEAITDERIKILKALIPDPKKIVFGQYEGYKSEPNVNPESQTETFYALKLEINNPKLKGVPIYIRSGKMLKQTVTEIAIIFKSPINKLFKHLDCGDEPNVLIYRIQPNEGIVFKVLTKKPGHKLELQPEYMQFCYPLTDTVHYLPDPYERLFSDVIRGDQTFFNDAEEVEAQWAFIDPLLKERSKPVIYKKGTWGPKEADELIKADGRTWIEPSMDFCRI